MDTAYNVRIHKIDVYKSRTKNGSNTYWVCWKAGGKRFKEPFKHSALADSFRSELVAASRKGEAFRLIDGLPVSKARNEADMPWYGFACKYVDMKWPRSAATTRRTHAEAMTTLTMSMLSGSEESRTTSDFAGLLLAGVSTRPNEMRQKVRIATH